MRKTLLLVFTFFILFIFYLVFPYPEGYLKSTEKHSITIYDRNNEILMEILNESKRSGFSKYIGLNEVPQDFIRLLLYSEDRDFYRHHGISVKAIMRAIIYNIKNKKILSGASTITQQLVKSKKGIIKNNFFTKLLEIFESIKLELHFGKNEILESYINEVYLGNKIYGFEKACNIYFGKSLRNANLLEMCFLISIIKSPIQNDPYRKYYKVMEKAKRFLFSSVKDDSSGIKLTDIEKESYNEMQLEVLPAEREIIAPHFCFYVIEEAKRIAKKNIREIYTTFDGGLYKKLQEVMKNSMTIIKDKNAQHAGLLMVDNKNMELLIMIGSLDFFDDKGQINATTIRKQAASTMKPFGYALAIERNLFHTSSVLPDIYMQFYASIGKYIPKNYSETYNGPVRLAIALASSYNIPAVYVVDKIELYPFYNFLKEIGFKSIYRQPSFYGYGLVLGNADVSLLELVNAYTIFPRLGVYSRVKSIKKIVTYDRKVYYPKNMSEKRVLTKETAFIINHILSEYKYKIPSFGVKSPINFPFPFAVKTGTSKNFKDNFIVGYNERFTLGVWVGNLYNEPLKEIPAVAGAGILLRNVLLELWNESYSFPPFSKEGLSLTNIRICRLSGMQACNDCPETEDEIFKMDSFPMEKCSWHKDGKTILPEIYKEWAERKNFEYEETSPVRIFFPCEGDIFKIDRNVYGAIQSIPLKANSRFDKVDWYIDGKYFGSGKELHWRLVKGKHKIEAKASEFQDSVNIFVE